MKKVLLATALACMSLTQVDAAEQKIIRISTDNTDLVLQVAPNGRLYQSYFGEKLLHENDLKTFRGTFMQVLTAASPQEDGKCTAVRATKTISNRQ